MQLPRRARRAASRPTPYELRPTRLGAAALFVCLAALAGCGATGASGRAAGSPVPRSAENLAHVVLFDLADPSETEALARDCRELLSGIPGVLQLEVSTRAPELTAERNDQVSDVALWVLFESLAAHDAYQVHPKHRALVDKWGPRLTVTNLRVFDGWLVP
jgi:hypothetical protein